MLWIGEGVDLELAAVAGARIDVAYRQRTPEQAQHLVVEAAGDLPQRVIRLWCGLGDEADLCDLSQQLVHAWRSCPA